MTSCRDMAMLLHYSAWANTRLYATLAAAPAPLIDMPRPGRPAGLIGTLSHMLVVDLIWRAHLQGRDHGFQARTLDPPQPLAQVQQAQRAVDQWYIDHAQGLDGAALAQVLAFSFVDGGSGAMRRGDMLRHVVNHKTYHRGYVADMLCESGLRPPTIDLPVFLRDAWPALLDSLPG